MKVDLLYTKLKQLLKLTCTLLIYELNYITFVCHTKRLVIVTNTEFKARKKMTKTP